MTNPDRLFRRLMATGAVCAALGVAAGAFGAHLLKGVLDQPMLAVYDTATRYQMYHAFGILVSGIAVRISGDVRAAVAGWMFLAGTVLFAGSLYGMALLGIRWFGAVTPLGGLAFIAGWCLLGWRILISSPDSIGKEMRGATSPPPDNPPSACP